MVGIPKQFLNAGLEATEHAKAAVRNIEKAVREVVIPEDKLVRQPASDLFEKASEMTSKGFWEDVENVGQYVRGQHLADVAEGKYVAVADGKIGERIFYGSNVKASFNAEGKAERVLVGNNIYEMDPNTGRITAKVKLDKNGKIDSIVKYDTDGYEIQEVIPAKGNKPKVVTDLSWDGGYPYRRTEYFADGTYTVTQDKVKNFYNADNQRVRANFYDTSDSMGLPKEKNPGLSMIRTYDKDGEIVKTIHIDPDTKAIKGMEKDGIYTDALS
ncbi:hypothetical protein IJ541_00585 [bacterium]|nr:hypothetical protein [bacterium]